MHISVENLKSNKKGGVVDLDLFPDREAFTTTCLLGALASSDGEVLLVPLFVPTLISLELLAVLPCRVLIKFS
jgi:hypothetical protein